MNYNARHRIQTYFLKETDQVPINYNFHFTLSHRNYEKYIKSVEEIFY